MDKLICNPIHSLFSFINEMKHLSISQWEVEQKALPSSNQTIRQQNDNKR